MLPHVVYGAGLHSSCKQDVKAVQALVTGVGLKRPLGTSSTQAQAVDKPGRSAEFMYHKEALVRRSKWGRKRCSKD